MGRKKQFIENLSIEEKTTLKQGYKNSPKSDFRKRCQMVLLSYKQMDVESIKKVTDQSEQTIYKVLAKWRKHGIAGLIRQKGQGRKPSLDINNSNHVKLVEQKVSKEPQNIESLIPEIVKELEVETFSKWTLKRFLKNLTTVGKDSEGV